MADSGCVNLVETVEIDWSLKYAHILLWRFTWLILSVTSEEIQRFQYTEQKSLQPHVHWRTLNTSRQTNESVRGKLFCCGKAGMRCRRFVLRRGVALTQISSHCTLDFICPPRGARTSEWFHLYRRTFQFHNRMFSAPFNAYNKTGNTEWPKKIYTLFTHQYLWKKFKWNFYFRVRV